MYIDNTTSNNSVEAFPERYELFLNVFVEQVVSVEEAVLLPVVVVDFDCAAFLHQLFNYLVSEIF